MRRKSSLPLPRYVTPESIEEGDTIRVTWETDDIEQSRTATVGRIIDAGFTGHSKTFLSPNGNEICQYSRTGPRKLRFTLLAEAFVNNDVPLFNMEEV